MDNLPEKKITKYDKKNVYKESIEPLLIEIKKLCVINQIPCFFSFATKNTETTTSYETDGIFTGSYDIHLASDMFPDMFAVINGVKYDVEKRRLILPDVGVSDREITNYIMDDAEDLSAEELLMTEAEMEEFLKVRTPKRRATKKEVEEKRSALESTPYKEEETLIITGKRGRKPKNTKAPETTLSPEVPVQPKRRGRPRKVVESVAPVMPVASAEPVAVTQKQEEVPAQPKKRGRKPKNVVAPEAMPLPVEPAQSKRRGRPKKVVDSVASVMPVASAEPVAVTQKQEEVPTQPKKRGRKPKNAEAPGAMPLPIEPAQPKRRGRPKKSEK